MRRKELRISLYTFSTELVEFVTINVVFFVFKKKLLKLKDMLLLQYNRPLPQIGVGGKVKAMEIDKQIFTGQNKQENDKWRKGQPL